MFEKDERLRVEDAEEAIAGQRYYGLVNSDDCELGIFYSPVIAQAVCDCVNSMYADAGEPPGTQLILHICRNPNPPEDKPDEHLMMLVLAPTIEGLIKRLLFIDEPLDAIAMLRVADRLAAQIYAERLGSFLARKGLYVFPSYNTGWEWFETHWKGRGPARY